MNDPKANDAISRSEVLEMISRTKEAAMSEEADFTESQQKAIEVIADLFADVFTDIPTLDVAPVVRCYECKYRCTQTCPMYHTEICLDDLDGFDSYDTDPTDDNGFCHLGARMDGEAE